QSDPARLQSPWPRARRGRGEAARASLPGGVPCVFPAGADRLDRVARELFVELPVAAGDADAAEAFAVHEDRNAAFHGGPAFRAGGEREAERVRDVERLSLRTLRAGGALVGSRAYRLGGRGMHRVEAAAVHAL